MNRRLFALGAVAALVMTAGPAAADLTPWEKFCLLTSKPGKDLANCLDGLPSGGGRNKTLTAPSGKPHHAAGRVKKVGALKTEKLLRRR
jgi:hypothetical protein